MRPAAPHPAAPGLTRGPEVWVLPVEAPGQARGGGRMAPVQRHVKEEHESVDAFTPKHEVR